MEKSVDDNAFEFKAPIIISKSPMKYAFQLIKTCPVANTYNTIVSFDQIATENSDYIDKLAAEFCNKCSKYFSKQLESGKLISRLTHDKFSVNSIEEDGVSSEDSDPVIYQWSYSPYRIIISGTEFIIEWCLDQIEIKCSIDIPDFIDSVPLVQLSDANGDENDSVSLFQGGEQLIEENNIPVSEDNNPVVINISKADMKESDIKKLKKAQLRVKLAKFKAEMAYEKYIQKWGYLSEDSGSESD
jgi:hypothetical protein